MGATQPKMGLTITLIVAKAIVLYLLVISICTLLINTALVIKAGEGTLNAKDWHSFAAYVVSFYLLNTIG